MEIEVSTTEYSYSVKVINPLGKAGHVVHALQSHSEFIDVSKLKESILSSCKHYIEEDKELQFGYIEPGHGKNGKQFELTSSGDLKEMYERYKKKRDILLWMKHSRKRPRSESDNPPGGSSRKSNRSSYEGQLNKMAQVDEIIDKLVKKHKETYTQEQYRVWALLLQMGKHDSYDCAPDKLFFKQGKKRVSEAAAAAVSPGKRLQMRSECIAQLDKWHQLMEKGAITSDQYKEIQDNIMNDIKKV